MSLLNHLS